LQDAPNRTLRIGLIIGAYPKDKVGGSELQTFLIGRELAKLGHEVYYFAIKDHLTR